VLNEPFHHADAAPSLGDLVPVVVEVPDAFGARRVEVRSTPDGEPRYAEATVDRRRGGSTWWRAEVEARNPVTRYRFKLDTAAGPRWLNALGVFAHDVPDVFDFRMVCYEAPPAWSADAVVYQIFPDRFARSSPKPAPDWAVPCAWVVRGRSRRDGTADNAAAARSSGRGRAPLRASRAPSTRTRCRMGRTGTGVPAPD